MKKNTRICSFVVLLLLYSSPVLAGVLDCNGCHAEKNDIRPIDSPFRNVSSGGFMGNHRTHAAAPTSFNSCVTCHNNDAYANDHLDGKIQFSAKINNYSSATGRAHYVTMRRMSSTSGMVFLNQTSLPVPGSCSNVNCHFEKVTPKWSSDIINCSTCHGAPPTGVSPAYSGGAAGSHARHEIYYSGTAKCNTCHSDHFVDARVYAHATSAGKRSLSVSLHDPQGNLSGIYSKSEITDYLPSRADGHVFGNCSSLYCHSPGTRSTEVLPANKSATWGETLGCDGCHQAIPSSGSHEKHVGTSKGVPVPCFNCHAATVNNENAIFSTTKHVNMKVDVAFGSVDTSILGTYSGLITPMQKSPGSGYAQCGNVYCHSSGQGPGGIWPPIYSSPKWGNPATGACGTCHADGSHVGMPLNSGSHARHIGYGFGIAENGRKNICGVCHYGTGIVEPDGNCGQCHYSSNAALSTKHMNHQVDVGIVSKFGGIYNGTPTPGDGFGNCSNTYCHSNGTAVSTAIVPTNTSPDWGETNTLTCIGCHDYPPAYQNGSPKANSHSSHSGFSCGACHAETSSDGTVITSVVKHVNKNYDLLPGPGIFFTYAYSASGGICSNISCHFNNSAIWGKTLKCGSCHSTSPGDQ